MIFLLFIEIYIFLKVWIERKTLCPVECAGGSLLCKFYNLNAYFRINSCKGMLCSASSFDLFRCKLPGIGISSSDSCPDGVGRLN